MPLIPIHPAFLPSAFFNPAILNCLDHLPSSYGLEALKAWYISADPLHPAIAFCTIMSFLVWVVGELTGESCALGRTEDGGVTIVGEWEDGRTLRVASQLVDTLRVCATHGRQLGWRRGGTGGVDTWDGGGCSTTRCQGLLAIWRSS